MIRSRVLPRGLPIWAGTLLLGGCVMHQGAAPPASMPAYIPPGSALGVSHLPPPVPLSQPGAAPAEDDALTPVTPITPGMALPGAPSDTAESPAPGAPSDATSTAPSDTAATAPSDSWQVAAPTSGGTSSDTAQRLDEIRARLAQDRAAPPRMPSRFGGLSDSGDVTPPN